MATMVTRTRVYITLYVHYPSCCILELCNLTQQHTVTNYRKRLSVKSLVFVSQSMTSDLLHGSVLSFQSIKSGYPDLFLLAVVFT
jgi:hypothetical protein